MEVSNKDEESVNDIEKEICYLCDLIFASVDILELSIRQHIEMFGKDKNNVSDSPKLKMKILKSLKLLANIEACRK